MGDLVARCPDCGREHPEEFAQCDWCGRRAPSRWWCVACADWRPTRGCPACGGELVVPPELILGSVVVGVPVPFEVNVYNPGKKPVTCAVSSSNGSVTVPQPHFIVPAGRVGLVRGTITVPPEPVGWRSFWLRFDIGRGVRGEPAGASPLECAASAELKLLVHVQPADPRLEFLPALVQLRTATPGGIVRSSVALKNTGNVPLTAAVASGAAWLSAEPRKLTLAPGEAAEVKLRARSKKTDSGPRETKLTAATAGMVWESTVRCSLPEPELTADPVAFGELKPGRATSATVIVRNTGRVRVNGTLESSAPWFQVVPTRINLQPGGEKTVRLRAVLGPEHDGPLEAELVLSTGGRAVLRVPVTATGVVPRPVLRAVRRQRLKDVIGPAVERKFQVANDGAGRLDLKVTADRPWLLVVTPELRVGPGKKRKVRYVVDLPALSHGEHSGTITLESNAGPSTVPVTVHVLDPDPVLEVVQGPDLGLVSPDLPLYAFVQVRNAGVGLLQVSAECEDTRVILSPTSAEVPAGPPVRFNLMIPVSGLPGGAHEAAVRFTSTGGDGRALVRFRLPVEMIDAPALINLGDHAAGQSTVGAIRVKNTGPDQVFLHVTGEHPHIRLDGEVITVAPGQTLTVPFRVELPRGVFGPVIGSIVLEGRTVRHAVAVRVTARKVELIVAPGVVVLGDLVPGEERAFTVDVVNAGEITTALREVLVPGDLEVWIPKSTVRPGERVTLSGLVRVNVRRAPRALRVDVPLADGVTVRCVASVVAPVLPRLLAAAIAAVGLVVGSALSVAGGWGLGVPLALVAMLTGAWLFWRETA
jgi:hypothetical protein